MKCKLKVCFIGVFIFILTSVAYAQNLSQGATNVGLNFGTMVTKNQYVSAPPIYQTTLLNDFNMLFPENEIKFKTIEPAQGQFAFSYPDSVINWALANGKKTRGHTLVWHSVSQNPKWLTDRVWSTSPNLWSKEELFAVLKNHIQTVVKHYKGRITEWDVLNEGINIGDGHPNGLRKSFWLNILGDSYIDSAFVWAHQADPSAYLYFNEFGAEGNGSWDKAKSDSVYSLVKRLLDRGIPVHGVGFQGHFNDYVNTSSISANIKRLGDLGLRVSITEIDMMNTSSKPTPWVNLMKACLDNKNCTSFVVWGVDDLHSWMGKDCACLLWDTLFKPKNLLYNGLITAINTANPSISADRKAFSNQPAYTPTPKPIMSNLSYCQGDLTKALTATGTSIKWYKSSQDSVPIPRPIPTSSVAETQLYYVTQTQNWLESEKAELKVTINSLPVLTQNTRTDTKGWTQTTTFNVCSGENIFTGPWPNVSNGWTWKGPNGFSASIRNPILSNINKTQEGIYTATYTDVKGCRNNINLNIVVSVPSITITSPANNAASTTDLVPINTTVSGTNMSNVTFYNGTNILGTKTTSPYSFTTPSLANGTYTLSAIAKNTFGCTDTAKVEVTVNKIITGLEEENLHNDFVVYPNPFTHDLTLNQQGGFEYSISTISGKILEHGNAFDHVIVGNNLPIGIYLINIKSSNKNFTYRIIKQ